MKYLHTLLLCLLFSGCSPDVALTPQGRLDTATKKFNEATTDGLRFYPLNDMAKQSFVLGKTEDARKYAIQLLSLAEKLQGDWNYGNAIQDGNVVLGRLDVREGRMEDAKKHLLADGKSRGSPQMDTFGPNLSLAKDILEKGERETVLQYFELCRKFWKMFGGNTVKSDRDGRAVKHGAIGGSRDQNLNAFGSNVGEQIGTHRNFDITGR